jgi:hypothetical protein
MFYASSPGVFLVFCYVYWSYFLLTVVDPPLSPPPLSTPAGAERGANNRIWPCLFTEDVHGLGQHNGWCGSGFGPMVIGTKPAPGTLRRGEAGDSDNSNSYNNSGNTPRVNQTFPHWFTSNPDPGAQTTQHPHQANTTHKAKRLVRFRSKHTATYGCLAPLSAPAGVERGWGIGGENTSVSNAPRAAGGQTQCH